MRHRHLSAVVAAGLLALGCSAKDEAPEAGAAPEAAAETAAATGAQTAEQPAEQPAAAKKPEPTTPEGQLKARLYGDWHLDLKSLGDSPEFKHLPPQQKEQAIAMAQRMLADVEFSFGEDGRIALGFGPARRKGTYVIDEIEGNALRITATVGQGDDATVEKVLLRIEGDAMWVTEGADNRTLRLLRGKPPVPTSQPTSQPTSMPARGAAGSQPVRRAPGSQPAQRSPHPRPSAPAPSAPE